MTEGIQAGTVCTLTLPGSATLELVWCPPGSFMMGSPATEEGRDKYEEIQHRVILTKGFWIGKYPVTQAQWKSVMAGEISFVYRSSRDLSDPSCFKGDNLPVDNVSWKDCQKFCQKAGFDLRLPTEAEWEYACRAGSTTAYCWGDTMSNGRANCDGLKELMTDVGSYPSGKNDWGIYDMHGNVCEWCQDWIGPYRGSDEIDPLGAVSGHYRVLRGGCWYDSARRCRSAFRDFADPFDAGWDYGFRVACSAGSFD